MSHDLLAEDETRRPPWLVTLADLMLLLVGFFVFLQANNRLDGKAIADGMRAGFHAARAPELAVAADRVDGFAPGSAALPEASAPLGWVADQLRDPRLAVRVVGGTAREPGDVDRQTGSAAILAADRARAVAGALAARVAPARIQIESRPGAGRAVQLELVFAGSPK